MLVKTSENKADVLQRKFPQLREIFSSDEYKVFRDLYVQKQIRISRHGFDKYFVDLSAVIRRMRKKIVINHLPFVIFTDKHILEDKRGYTLWQFL